MALSDKRNMIITKEKYISVVIEGFLFLFLSKVLITVLAALLHSSIPFIPDITMVFLAAVVACTLTIIYLYFRTNYWPTIAINSNILAYSIAGIVIIWLLQSILSLFGVNGASIIKNILSCRSYYKYINLLCFIIIGPITEEIIYRGYFVKMLSNKGTLYALTVTSALFVASHILLHDYSPVSMTLLGINFFIFSMTAGFVYTQAGLIAAILVHIFGNLHILIQNA